MVILDRLRSCASPRSSPVASRRARHPVAVGLECEELVEYNAAAGVTKPRYERARAAHLPAGRGRGDPRTARPTRPHPGLRPRLLRTSARGGRLPPRLETSASTQSATRARLARPASRSPRGRSAPRGGRHERSHQMARGVVPDVFGGAGREMPAPAGPAGNSEAVGALRRPVDGERGRARSAKRSGRASLSNPPQRASARPRSQPSRHSNVKWRSSRYRMKRCTSNYQTLCQIMKDSLWSTWQSHISSAMIDLG